MKSKPVCPICGKADLVYHLGKKRLLKSPFFVTTWFCARCGKKFTVEKKEEAKEERVEC